MDNVKHYEMKHANELVNFYGHEIRYLPPYFSFLNPIEKRF